MTRTEAVLLAAAALVSSGIALLLPPRAHTAGAARDALLEISAPTELSMAGTGSSACGGPGGRFGGPGTRR